MKENIHILEILKQISEVKSNVKMKTSKCSSFLTWANIFMSEHLMYQKTVTS